ncbi:MAG TPA: hypothetical protein VMF60_05400 [Acidimicrobiales bacterium]|nr:hypothetical protein [Acidimicrobiales bacterium]
MKSTEDDLRERAERVLNERKEARRAGDSRAEERALLELLELERAREDTVGSPRKDG